MAPALESLKRQGKIGVAGFTANGETAALHEIVATGIYGAAQVFYNLLNPSAGGPLPPGFPAQDFRRLLDRTGERGMGAVVVRVLAAGALSGTAERHRVAAPSVDPIASGPDYAADVRRAEGLAALVREGATPGASSRRRCGQPRPPHGRRDDPARGPLDRPGSRLIAPG